MENNLEHGPERLPSAEDVLEIMGRKAENLTLERELHDHLGLYMLEARTPETGSDYTQYVYMRQGEFYDNNRSQSTTIYSVEYQDNEPCGGSTIANYVNGNWEDVH